MPSHLPAGERAGPEQAPSGAEDNAETAAGAEVIPLCACSGLCASCMETLFPYASHHFSPFPVCLAGHLGPGGGKAGGVGGPKDQEWDWVLQE